MTRWARLTWQAADPGALASSLGRRLGLDPRPHPGLHGAFLLPLGADELEVVPWRRESAADEPRAAGRLVLEPIDDGAPDPEPTSPPLRLAGVGWATVELDRAEADLDAWLEPREAGTDPGDGAEPHLGGRTRVRRAAGLPAPVLVLAEPATEGRLAASLARDGEGPCALYLWPPAGLAAWLEGARARGTAVSAAAGGPFGRSVLLAGDAAAGPHLIVVAGTTPSSGRPPAGTIRP